ncbi:MAG: hypothetical protein HY720_02440 [Planctomycetes bacterium]|nr:hypothetical protein [Planctomycetota bacterium]
MSRTMSWLVPSVFVFLSSFQAPADDFVVHEWGYFIENGSRDPVEILDSMPGEVPNFRTWTPYGGRFKLLASRGDLDLVTGALSLGDGAGMSSAGTGSAGTGSRWSSSDASVRQVLQNRYAPRPRSASSEPYLYFYSDRAREVDVRVRFPGGAPLFWWPVARVASEGGGSSLEWPDVQILPRGSRAALRPWSSTGAFRLGLERARQVDSCPVKVANVTDRYLFYEGTVSTDSMLGRHFSWDGWHLANLTSQPIFDVLVFAPGSKRPLRIPWIEPGTEAIVPAGAEGNVELDEAGLAGELAEAGLFSDEAAAMAASVWGTGFLDAAGTRVLYRIPRETYDRIYPLSIDPSPNALVRVGLVLSYDLDPALEAVLARLGGSRLKNAEVRESLEAQVLEILKSRIEALEPLTPAMVDALALETEEIAALRARTLPPSGEVVVKDEVEALLAALRGAIARADKLEELLRSLAQVRTSRAAPPEEVRAFVEELSRFELSPAARKGFAGIAGGIREFRPTDETLGRLAELVKIVRDDAAEARSSSAARLSAVLGPYLYAGGVVTPAVWEFLKLQRGDKGARALVTTIGVPYEAIR